MKNITINGLDVIARAVPMDIPEVTTVVDFSLSAIGFPLLLPYSHNITR